MRGASCWPADAVRGWRGACQRTHGGTHGRWDGACGLIDVFSPDELVQVLKVADLHTRALWTELVCKSFRVLRGELVELVVPGQETNICNTTSM